MNTNNEESPFGEVIFSYTRAQAWADNIWEDQGDIALRHWTGFVHPFMEVQN